MRRRGECCLDAIGNACPSFSNTIPQPARVASALTWLTRLASLPVGLTFAHEGIHHRSLEDIHRIDWLTNDLLSTIMGSIRAVKSPLV